MNDCKNEGIIPDNFHIIIIFVRLKILPKTVIKSEAVKAVS